MDATEMIFTADGRRLDVLLSEQSGLTRSRVATLMEEGQVTVDGISHPLPQPFVVIATQNPTGAAGTQLLPDSQMDRFMVRLSLGYPEPKDEIAMVKSRQGKNPLTDVIPVLSARDLTALQQTVDETHISDDVTEYVVSLIQATRGSEFLLRGASPRATLAVTSMSKAVAQLRGRDYVIPKDVQEAFVHTVAHRLLLSEKAEGRGITAEQVLQQILAGVEAPKLR